jgi:glutathione reductase (NADPH)
MSERPFLFVIGAGTAGNTCGRAVARAGHEVVAAERDRVGGLCLWAGCMPKKALYNAASAARSLSKYEQFGVECTHAQIDWPGVLAWKWHAQETYAGDQDAIAADTGIEVIHSPARFTAPRVVEAGGVEYRPEHIVIACGSEPVIPDIPGIELADTSREALSYPELPASLAVIGAGFIAMEFAGIFASFGTEVTVLMRDDRPLDRFDPELVDVARVALEEIGVRFLPDASTTAVEGEPGTLRVRYDSGGETRTLGAERVLVATGRRPALGDLRPDVAGLATDERGHLSVHDHFRTSDPSVWVAGDAAGGPQFTPVASTHGSLIARALLGGKLEEPDYSCIPSAVFTVPELARVGLSESEAQEQGLEYSVRRQPFEYVGAAIIRDERKGLVKLLVDPDDRILGAHIAGAEASELIYPYAVAIKSGATIDQVAAARAIHPALTEVVNWATQ